MIKLIYPDPQKLKLAGAKPVSTVSLRWTDKHPQSSYGLGVLLYGKSSDIFDGQAFRAARDIFGATLVSDMPHGKICGALGVPQSENGIIEAFTVAQYAGKHQISRQYTQEMIQSKKLPAEKIGESWFIKK